MYDAETYTQRNSLMVPLRRTNTLFCFPLVKLTGRIVEFVILTEIIWHTHLSVRTLRDVPDKFINYHDGPPFLFLAPGVSQEGLYRADLQLPETSKTRYIISVHALKYLYSHLKHTIMICPYLRPHQWVHDFYRNQKLKSFLWNQHKDATKTISLFVEEDPEPALSSSALKKCLII